MLLADDANTRVRYVPDGTSFTEGTLTFRAWDQTVGSVGGRFDLSDGAPVGGSTAFSADEATSKVAVSNVIVEGNTLKYGAAEGQRNRIQISVNSGNELVISDLNKHMINGQRGVFKSSLVNFDDLNIDTGGQDDIITVGNLRGFGGNLKIDGAGGFDKLIFTDPDLILGAGNNAELIAD